jgi:hypothetical protein
MSQDPYASAVGIATSTVLAQLLRALLRKNVLTQAEMEDILGSASQKLATCNTDVAFGGIGIVESLRDGLIKQ